MYVSIRLSLHGLIALSQPPYYYNYYIVYKGYSMAARERVRWPHWERAWRHWWHYWV